MIDQVTRSGVLTIGDTQYAVGLFWQTAEEPGQVRKEAEEAARQEEVPADFYCVREGYVTQFGLGWESAGHGSGMSSAAAALAGDLAGNWMGVFNTDQGWWFVAARRDAILPDGDQLFTSEAEPRARFEQEFQRGGWDKVYIPPEWELGGDQTPLSDLLEAASTETKLRSLKSGLASVSASVAKGGSSRALLMVLLLMVAGAGGYYYYDNYMVQPEIAQQVMNQQPVQVYIPPDRKTDWNDYPQPSRFLARCQDEVASFTRVLIGWQITSISCEFVPPTYGGDPNNRSVQTGGEAGGRVTVVWRRDGGTLSLARQILNPIPMSISADGNEIAAIRTFQFAAAERRNPTGDADADERDVPQAEIEFYVYDSMQAMGQAEFRLEFNEVPFTNPDAVAKGDPPNEPLPASLQISSSLPPVTWGDLLDRLPATWVQAARLDLSTQEWTYLVQTHTRTPAVDEWEMRQNTTAAVDPATAAPAIPGAGQTPAPGVATQAPGR